MYPGNIMPLKTLEQFNRLFIQGNARKYYGISEDCDRALVREEVSSQYWYEQVVVTETRIKAFFTMPLTIQQNTIKKQEVSRLQRKEQQRCS